jgi:hypothetical protein
MKVDRTATAIVKLPLWIERDDGDDSMLLSTGTAQPHAQGDIL